MIRLLAIPLIGTAAALVVVFATHAPREDVKTDDAGPDLHSMDDLFPDETPGDTTEPPMIDDEPADETPAPRPDPVTYEMRLEADGALVDEASGVPFENAAALAERLLSDSPVRHVVILSNGAGVDRETLEAAATQLREHFDVRTYYLPPDDDAEDDEADAEGE